MGVLNISYSSLNSASKNAKNTSKELDDYASKLERTVATKLKGYSGASNNISDSCNRIDGKIKELREKSEKLNNYSIKISNFKDKVNTTDIKISKEISTQTKSFAERNGFKLGVINTVIQTILVKKFNKTELSRLIIDIYNKGKDKVLEWKDSFKHWWHTGGGKFWGDIAAGVIAIAVAAFTILTAGTGALAVAAGIAAIITIVNSTTDIIHSVKALCSGDPAIAEKHGNVNKASDWLRLNGYDGLAKILDITEGIVGVVAIGSSVKNIGNSIKKIGNKKNIGFLKKLLGDGKDNLGILAKKFATSVDGKYVVTGKSFFKGSSSVVSDKSFRQELLGAFKDNPKIGIKDIIKGFGKNSIDNVKDVFTFKHKNYDSLQNSNIFGHSISLNENLEKALIGLNKADSYIKQGQKINKFKDNIEKLINGKFYDRIGVGGELITASEIQSIKKEFKKIAAAF